MRNPLFNQPSKRKGSLYSEKNIIHLLTILESIEKIILYTLGFPNKTSFYESEDQVQYNAVCLNRHLTINEGYQGKINTVNQYPMV